jgi:hypothetical protein
MRQVSKQIREAFMNGKSKTVGNTSTDGQRVCLFGNEIIRKEKDGYSFTCCGWDSRTTLERINSILGINLHTQKGIVMCGDETLDLNQRYQIISGQLKN